MTSTITVFSTVIILGVVFLFGGGLLVLKTGGSPLAYFKAQFSDNDRQRTGAGSQTTTGDTTGEPSGTTIEATSIETGTQTKTVSEGDIHSVATGNTDTTTTQSAGSEGDLTTTATTGTQTDTSNDTDGEDNHDGDDFGIDDGRGDEYSMYDEETTDDTHDWVDHEHSEADMTDTAIDSDALTGVDSDIRTPADSTDTNTEY